MIQDLIRTWWPILAFILNGCFFLVIWALVKTFAKKEDVDELKKDHESLRQQVAKLPDHSEIADLKLTMEQLRGDIREIRPKLDGLDRISNLLLENELKEKN